MINTREVLCESSFSQCELFKGIVSKFWNFLYYLSDLTEIFTQYVKSKKKHFLFLQLFPFRA